MDGRWWSLLLIVPVLGCGTSHGTPRPCTTGSDCASTEACIDGRCTAVSDGGGMDAGSTTDLGVSHGAVTGIAIHPADSTLVLHDGARTTVGFGLTVTYADATTMDLLDGAWSLDSEAVGTIDRTSAVFTPDGDATGTVTVAVDALGMHATTHLTVQVVRDLIVSGAPADAPTRFAGATSAGPDPDVTLLYPLDGVRFPQNVAPPDVQWDGGADGDLYRVTLQKPGVTISAYLLHSGAAFTYDYAVDASAWSALAEADTTMPGTITVDRLDGAGALHEGHPITIQFANGSVTGAIYYWSLDQGRIERIRGDGTGREDFMPSPPVIHEASGDVQCAACHAISRDGRKMVVALGHAGQSRGTIFDLTVDLTGSPPPELASVDDFDLCSATWSADGTRVLLQRCGAAFELRDGTTGAHVAAGGSGLPGDHAAQPEWSPDGTAIAYASNISAPGGGVDFGGSNLGLVPVTGTDTFGPPTNILSTGTMVARPTWSPDSQWLAIQYGAYSRSDGGGGMVGTIDGRIALVPRAGGTVIELPALNAGEHRNYYPTFSPFDSGGYFWVAFFSTRPYGNAHVGTAGVSPPRRQLWVAAVSNHPDAATDPSSAPYWLPQQDVAHGNMAAFWAQEPCRAEGRDCSVSSECCSGFCRDRGGMRACVPPTESGCSMVGESCTMDSDCCASDMAVCSGNHCTVLH